jgi:NAD(P)-dependent dehydrogenase (short-subunit alcohol dehydrogenase family)
MIDLTDNTVVITGASRGIGEAAARHLAERGATVVLSARSAAPIEKIAEDIRKQGGRAFARVCDVSVGTDVLSLVDFALESTSRLDALINNAGVIEPIVRLADSYPDEWSRIVDINFKGVYYGMRYAIPAMLERGDGTIVNISSGAATSALEGWSHYCSTKAAVLSLTRCAHREYGNLGIRILGLSPGTVATQMQVRIRDSGINPVSQMDPSAHIPAEWVARAVAFLLGAGGDKYLGTDFSLKTDEGRKAVGLPPATAQ